jgi:hypothetical protein
MGREATLMRNEVLPVLKDIRAICAVIAVFIFATMWILVVMLGDKR